MTSARLSAPRGKVAAVIVTYFPDAELAGRVENLRRQLGRVAIVDNGSDEASLAPLMSQVDRKTVTLHRNGANLGIAAALNRGMELLAAEAYEWVVTLDQDSTVRPGFVEALWQALENDPRPDGIAMVGANRLDLGIEGAGHRWLRPKKSFPFFERVGCRSLGPDGTTLVITSGTLTRIAAFQRLGPFREDFFIDLVDIEYCLRARRSGYRIIVSPEAELVHQVGRKQRVARFGLTISPTFHSPLRRYYLFRNSIPVLRSYGVACPHWLAYHLLALAEVVAGILLAEDGKLAKLRACAAGVRDGLRGRSGPAPSSI